MKEWYRMDSNSRHQMIKWNIKAAAIGTWIITGAVNVIIVCLKRDTHEAMGCLPKKKKRTLLEQESSLYPPPQSQSHEDGNCHYRL